LRPAEETERYTVAQAPPEPSTELAPVPVPLPVAGLPVRVPGQFNPKTSEPAMTARSETPVPSLRIGRGVPLPTATGRPAERPSRPRGWGLVTRIVSAVLTVAIIATAAWTGWQWWQRLHDKVAVAAVTVAPAQPLAGQCDVQYDIVGTIRTNGKAGTITYQWLRSDGQQSGSLNESMASGQTSTTVHLYWTFTGEGAATARATLRVLDPRQVDGSTDFVYSCS
jgi:hypothetical protein